MQQCQLLLTNLWHDVKIIYACITSLAGRIIFYRAVEYYNIVQITLDIRLEDWL